jgi:hypothetical protein
MVAMIRIVGVKWQKLALILAIIYPPVGLTGFFFAYIRGDASFTLPIGFVMPLVNFAINLHLPRGTSFAYDLLLGLGTLVAYAVSGWITGAVVAGVFNLAASWLGGIDANHFVLDSRPLADESTLLNSQENADENG